MKYILITIIFGITFINSSESGVMLDGHLTNNIVITSSSNADFSKEKLREIGKRMSKEELGRLESKLFDFVIQTENKKQYYYLHYPVSLNYTPVSLVAGVYENDMESLLKMINTSKSNLLKYIEKRGLDKGFNREASEEREFVNRYYLYRNLLLETIKYANDFNDSSVFWNLIEENRNVSFVDIRNELVLQIKEWLAKHKYVPVGNEKYINTLNQIKSSEEEFIKDTKDFKDFINFHSSSEYIIQNINEILSKVK